MKHFYPPHHHVLKCLMFIDDHKMLKLTCLVKIEKIIMVLPFAGADISVNFHVKLFVDMIAVLKATSFFVGISL